MKFSELPLHENVQSALEAMGFEETTPVQEQTILPCMEGKDVLGQAQTGTGKTAAFGIPLVEAAIQGKRGLVLAPTRELAKQVQRELQAIGKGSPVEAVCLIGGAHFGDQVRALERHPRAILVATPGRIVDHLERGTLHVDDMHIFVLDEADEMLSMGFADELDKIVERLPQQRQTLLFSATMTQQVERLAKKSLNDPVVIRVSQGATRQVRQCFAVGNFMARAEHVARILAAEDPQAAILFAKTRGRVDDLAKELGPLGAEALHGGMQQGARDGVMQRLRSGQTKLIVATDVAARGLDIEELELVLHDEPPSDTDTYIHRMGRTGRAGRTGMSIVFVGPGKMRRLTPINRQVGDLEKYEVPTDVQVARIQATRLLDEVRATVPGDVAKSLYQEALDAGLSPDDIAQRALESLLEQRPTVDAPEAATDTETVAVALKVGSMDRVQPGSIVACLCNTGGLRSEDIGRIDILEKMSVVEVPRAEADRLIEALDRAKIAQRFVMPRLAEDWRFKAQPGRGGAPSGGYNSGYQGRKDSKARKGTVKPRN